MLIKAKALNDSAWKDIVSKNKGIKDNGILKALVDLKKVPDEAFDDAARLLDEVLKLAAQLKKDKGVVAVPAAVKHLAEVVVAAEALRKDVTKAKADAAKEAKAKAQEEVEDESDELLTTRLLPLLKLAMKGEQMHALVASAGKDVAVMLSRKPIPPTRRKLLADRLDASGGVKYFSGHCVLDPETRATTFVLLAEVTGMAKKLKRALLQQTGLKVNKVSCRGADGAADHDGEESGQESAAIGVDDPDGDPSVHPLACDLAACPPGPAAGGAGSASEERKTGSQQDDATDGKPAGPGPGASSTGRVIPYRVPVDREMDNVEFSIYVHMFVMKLPRAEAERWVADPAYRIHPLTAVVSAASVKRGYVLVNYRHQGLAPVSGEEVAKADGTFKGYAGARRDEVNRRTDEEFWKRTGLPPGTRIDPKDPNFKTLSQAWKELRTDTVKLQELQDRIPPEAKQFLKFAPGGVPVTDANIDRIIAIAQKVRSLTPEEMAEYWAATEGKTDDIDTFSASVDGYLKKVQQRRATDEKLDQAHNKLVGKEELLRLYKKSRESRWQTTDEFGVVDQTAVDHNVQIEQARRELGPLLQRWGYADTSAFEADVQEYETAFRDQAITTADRAMDRREHELWRFQEDVLTPDSVQGMFNALQAANAKRDELLRDRSLRIDGGDGKTFTNWVLIRSMLRPVLEQAIEKDPGLQRLIELRKQEDPNFKLDDDMVDMLSTANSADELTKALTRMLSERREGIAETRQLLKDKPDKIWKFDKALAYGKAHADASQGSVQDQIVNDKIKDEASSELGKKLLVGALAIGAGLLTFGEGTVAVLGGAAALGIGAADAWDTYTSYTEEHAANQAGLSSSDPSFAWVVVALATLPIDVLAVGSAIKAAKAAPHIAKILEAGTDTGKAVRAFNKAGEAIETAEDAAKALARLEQELATAQKDVRAAIVRAARAEAEAKAAWATARKARAGRAMAYLDPIVTPLADLVVSFAYPVAMSIRKGLTKFDAFLKSGFAKALIKDAGALSPEAMVNLEKAFAQAKAGWEVAAKKAVDLGMTDVELERAMKIWAGKPDLDAARFVTEVLEPMASARKTVPEFAKVVKQTETLPGGVASLEEALVKAAGDPAYAKQLGPHLKDLRREIESMDPAVRKALPDASKAALDTISLEAGEQLLKDADIQTGTMLRKGSAQADLDPAEIAKFEWNHEKKVVDKAEGIGGARLNSALGGTVDNGTEEGVDFVIKAGSDVKTSLKGPLVNKQTGALIPITDKAITAFAKSAVKDLTQNTATQQLVVDMMGLTTDQRALLQSELKRLLDLELANPGIKVQNGKTILFLE